MRLTRRGWLAGLGAAAPVAYAQQRRGQPLDIQDYQPKSMLVVEEHTVERARSTVCSSTTSMLFGW